jgi:hypothetical protein
MIVDAMLGKGSDVTAVIEILHGGQVPHLYVGGNAAWARAQRPDAIGLEKPYGKA